MTVTHYFVRRTVNSVIVVFAIVVLNFFVFRIIPGDPVSILLKAEMSAYQKLRLRHLFGLDRPLHEQFVLYLYNMLRGEWGFSFSYGFRPVSAVIFERLPNTILLLLPATILSVLLGVAVGVYAGSRRGAFADVASVTTGLTLYSLPTFWLALMLLFVFASVLGWFPTHGSFSTVIEQNGRLIVVGPHPFAWLLDVCPPLFFALDYLWHLILPMLTITLVSFGYYLILLRNTLVEVFAEDYILTARAKGLDEKTVLYKHALRNAALPLITVTVLAFAGVVSGAVLTETVFSWFGMGRLVFEAVLNHDYPVLQAAFFMFGVLTVAANLLADLLYAYFDPRVRY